MKTRALILSLILVFACFWAGCGGINGGNIANDPVPNYGTISGTISDPTNSASLRARTSGSYLEGASVFIEERPELLARADSNGKFTIVNVPDDLTYHLIAKYHSSNNYYYRYRSPAFSLSGPYSQKDINIPLLKADNGILLKVMDNQSHILPFTNVNIWGDTFQTNASGQVLLQMPEGNVEINISNYLYASYTTALNFSSTSPSYVQYTLMPTTESNHSPSVSMAADHLTVGRGGQVSFTATGYDPDRDHLTYSWDCTSGVFASDSAELSRLWYAPNFDSFATITVQVSDGRGGKNGVGLLIKIGEGVATVNSPPVITAIDGSSSVLINTFVPLEAKASDPDSTPSKYFWSCNIGSFSYLDPNNLSASATWQAPAQTGSATITLTAYDGRDYSIFTTFTKKIDVLTVLDRAPAVEIVATGTRILPSTTLSLVASGTDPEGDSITYSWSASGGTFTASSGSSVSWTAPASPGNILLTLSGNDNRGGIGTGTLTINVINPVNHSPVVTVSPSFSLAPIGLGVNLIASASDPDSDPLSYNWTADGGSFSSSSSSATLWYGTASKTNVVTCTVSDGRGRTASSSASVQVVSNTNMPLGDFFAYDIATRTSVNLPTGTDTVKFGLVLYSKKLDNSSYTISINGGGAELRPLSAISPSARARPFSDSKIQLDKQMRQREKEIIQEGSLLAPVSASPPPELPLYFQEQFLVPSDEMLGVSTISARLMATGTKCEIFVDYTIATDSDTANSVASFSQTFDSKVYPFIMQNYASEPEYLAHGDVNSDGKITVLFTPIMNSLGAAGMFDAKDLTTNWYSNRQDMFYVYDKPSYMTIASWQDDAVLTLVHEFQHLVNFVAHTKINGGSDEDVWLNEGLSVGAEVRYSGKTSSFFPDYAVLPEGDSLLIWSDSLSDYGSSGLFTHFMFEQLGTATIRNLVRTNSAGIDNINTNSSSRQFWQLFQDWGLALFRYGRSLPANPTYDYALDLGITLKKSSLTYTGAVNATMRGSAFKFLEISSSASPTAVIDLCDKLGTGKFGATFIRIQ
ncbi:MAG: hypothetical protein HQM08_07760 [Candidatus Riflebacteria bacterium]|nr:hypothetical protein [Candidatus Riflebacteria bacterium]